MCLTASGGGTADNTPLVQDPYTGTTSQLWNVTSLGNGQYYALGVASGRAIDVTNTAQNGNGLNAGDVIQLYDWKTESAEEFTLQDASEGEGYDSIIFVNSGMAMTVSGASTAAGAAIVQDPVTAGATNAQWEFQTP
jgi:alpha-L-fucosidase